MHTKKTKTKNYIRSYAGEYCIAQIVVIAEPTGFRVYVAWEWEVQAKQGNFAFAKSVDLYPEVSEKAIMDTLRFGNDIGHRPEVKQVFKNLF